MKNLLVISTLVLFLVSCKEVSGTFVVLETFTANVNKKCGWNPFGNCNPNKKLEILAGDYASTINFGSKTEIRIEMKANAYKETIILKRPKNFEFPVNGDFLLTKVETNQEFDVAGQVSTTVSDSPLQRENESCTYTVPDYVCTPDGNGYPQCSYQNRTEWGYRYVEYFNRDTTRTLFADLVNNQKTLAQFRGVKTETEKIYRYTSICR